MTMNDGAGNEIGNEAARVLDPSRLIAHVEAATGLNDWGTPEFRTALDQLCASAIDEADLQGAALAGFAATIERLLTNRLRLYADRAAFPEIATQKIVAPLIVTGLPRGGTTILHGLLAQDPAARSAAKWEVDCPSPPPRAENRANDPRIAISTAAVEAIPAAFRAMHAMGATLPEECNNFFMMAFRSPNFGATANLPSYMRWLIEDADMAPAFEFHRHFLQHLQAFAPAGYWVLKAPPYLWWPEALFAAYPDARVVVTHRDPADVMPSNASLIAYLRGYTGTPDPLAVGKEQVGHWRTGLDRMHRYRSSGAHSEQFIDTYYTDFVSAPMGVVATIYDRFDMTLSNEARDAMTRFLAGNTQGKHGRHDYQAETFGLSRETLHREFGDYIAAYAIPTR
jgi:hypothetical protein